MLIVTPNSVDSLHIQWSGLEGEMFNVYRSTSPESGYEIIATEVTLPFFVDTGLNLYDVGTNYYYMVKGLTGGAEVSEEKGETVKYNKRDPIANKVIYESQVVLRMMNNPPVKILLKHRTGKRCPECWNPITNKPRYANCRVCNGTGTITGYHEPIETKISREFSHLMDNSDMLDGEKIKRTNVNAWISNVPLVNPGDVVVDILNQRYLIERVIQRTRSQYIIRQIIDMIPLEKGHPAHQVEVEWSGMP